MRELYQRIDDSMVQMAARLGPEGIDRDLVRPVAAMALWSLSDTRLALVRSDDPQASLIFPVSDQELPVITDRNPYEVKHQLADFLYGVLDELQVPRTQVARVVGLNIRARGLDRTPEPPMPGQGRARLTFPLLMAIHGLPPIRNGEWFDKESARDTLHDSRTHHLGHSIMLESVLASSLTKGLPTGASYRYNIGTGMPFYRSAYTVAPDQGIL